MERQSRYLSELDSKVENPVNRINLSNLFKIAFFSSFLMLISIYLILFYGLAFFLKSDQFDNTAVEEQEEKNFLYRYRTLIYAISLVPSILLGIF